MVGERPTRAPPTKATTAQPSKITRLLNDKQQQATNNKQPPSISLLHFISFTTIQQHVDYHQQRHRQA